MIMIRNCLEFELKSIRQDNQGRFILLEALVQDQKFILLNIYAPDKSDEQLLFFDQIKDELDGINIEDDCKIIIGRGLYVVNVILDPDFDSHGGKPKLRESLKQIEDICLLHYLVDIWRIRNPETKRFTWRQKTPLIQRLDF